MSPVEHFLYIQKPPAKPRNPGRSGYCSAMTAYVLEAIKETRTRYAAVVDYDDIKTADVLSLIDGGFYFGSIISDHNPVKGFRRSSITHTQFYFYDLSNPEQLQHKPLYKLKELVSTCKHKLHRNEQIKYPRFKVTGNLDALIGL